MNTSILAKLKQKYGDKLTDTTPLTKIPSIVSSLEWEYLRKELKYRNHRHQNFNEFIAAHNEMGSCICGEDNCTERYEHWTSGW
tara:strand:- start:4176 stop:4427 length:252 start_codon:yes stop_codon:yes gene_type:complete